MPWSVRVFRIAHLSNQHLQRHCRQRRWTGVPRQGPESRRRIVGHWSSRDCRVSKAYTGPASCKRTNITFRIVESSVAIIVASLPAYVQFLRIYLLDSSWYKSLRSKIGSTANNNNGTYDLGGDSNRARMWTFGSGPQRKKQPS